MTTYRLDQLDQGFVSLPSGNWKWYVIRLMSLPEGTCEVQHLIFANANYAGDIMRAQVPSHLSEIDDESVMSYARQPDDRSFRTDKGRFQIRPPLEDGRQRMWSVRPEQGIPFRTDMHIEKSLGELTEEDLRELVRTAI
jgi:hypothetical protein